jgi:hypothetical protein
MPADPILSPERREASLKKFVAMLLKRSYLRGEAVEKEFYRELALEGEQGIGEGMPSAMTPWSRRYLEQMPMEAWQRRRWQNHQFLMSCLSGHPAFNLLPGPKLEMGSPFLVVAVFERGRWRDAVRRDLLAARIYPGIHWPLDRPAIEGIPVKHIDLSRRILTLHCDLRYKEPDLEKIASVLRSSASIQIKSQVDESDE